MPVLVRVAVSELLAGSSELRIEAEGRWPKSGDAPAWEALGLRYYFDATYGDGGERNLTRSDAADERALALDPNLIFAGATSATNRADVGNIGSAFAQASTLVKDRPESAQAHFALARLSVMREHLMSRHVNVTKRWPWIEAIISSVRAL